MAVTKASLRMQCARRGWEGGHGAREEATGGIAEVAERCGEEKGLGVSHFPPRDWEIPPADA